MRILSRLLRITLEIAVFLFVIYLMTFILFVTITDKIEWNIFKSEALPEFLIFICVALPISILVRFLLYKGKKKNVLSKDNMGNDIIDN